MAFTKSALSMAASPAGIGHSLTLLKGSPRTMISCSLLFPSTRPHSHQLSSFVNYKATGIGAPQQLRSRRGGTPVPLGESSSSHQRLSGVCLASTTSMNAPATESEEKQQMSGNPELTPWKRIYYTISSAAQSWLLQHSNFLTKIIIKIFYILDGIDGFKADQKRSGEGGSSLWPRAKALGPNFCALGQVNIGDRDLVKKLILAPQKRGPRVAWISMVQKRFPKEMLLFMDSEGAGGDGLREKIKYLMSEEIFLTEGPMQRAADKYSQDLIKEFVAKAAKDTREPTDPAVKTERSSFAVKYIYYVVLDLKIDDYVEDAVGLIASYSGSRLWPVGLTKGDVLSDAEKKLFGLHEKSSVLQGIDYAKYGLTKEIVLRALQPAMAVAGMPALNNIVNFILNFTPPDANLNASEDKAELGKLFLLESLRFHTPVSTVDMVTHEPLTVNMSGKMVTYPPGTPVGLLLWMAQHDQRTFKEPHKFDPLRPNLLEETMGFHSVGYSNGGRSCPARAIMENFTGDYITSLKQAGWKPNNKTEWFK